MKTIQEVIEKRANKKLYEAIHSDKTYWGLLLYSY